MSTIILRIIANLKCESEFKQVEIRIKCIYQNSWVFGLCDIYSFMKRKRKTINTSQEYTQPRINNDMKIKTLMIEDANLFFTVVPHNSTNIHSPTVHSWAPLGLVSLTVDSKKV